MLLIRSGEYSLRLAVNDARRKENKADFKAFIQTIHEFVSLDQVS